MYCLWLFQGLSLSSSTLPGALGLLLTWPRAGNGGSRPWYTAQPIQCAPRCSSAHPMCSFWHWPILEFLPRSQRTSITNGSIQTTTEHDLISSTRGMPKGSSRQAPDPAGMNSVPGVSPHTIVHNAVVMVSRHRQIAWDSTLPLDIPTIKAQLQYKNSHNAHKRHYWGTQLRWSGTLCHLAL